jgi:hypothetical protein
MKKDLCDKINSLSSKDVRNYYIRLHSILNDSYSSFLYGGMNKEEYSSLPKEKVELAEEKLFKEMFEDNKDNEEKEYN